MFVRPLAALGVVLGIFLYGGAGVNDIYQKQIAELKQQVAIAEEKSKTVNTVVENHYVHDHDVIEHTKTVYRDQIKLVEKQIDKCPLDPIVSQIHNRAATNPLGDKK